MKIVICAVFLSSLLMSVSGLAQDVVPTLTTPLEQLPEPAVPVKAEQEQIVLPQFELVENPKIDQKIRELLTKNVTIFYRPAEKINQAELRLLRSAVRRQIADILATEGYFSPVIKFENAFENAFQNSVENKFENQKSDQPQKVVVRVSVEPGPPTKVANVQIGFVDANADNAVPVDLQHSIQSGWSLPKGELFRDDDWSYAKAQSIESLIEHGYAAAKISNSEAIIQDQQADLSVTLNSGPVFRFGELRITGLHSYGTWLLDRYHPPVKGEPYNLATLTRFQRELQNSPYFSSVSISIDPDAEMASAVPVNVLLQERKRYDIGLAAGYSSNTRARGEISFQDRDFYSDAFNLKSVLRIEQLRQIGYADIFLPPKPGGYLDSFGVLFERTNIEGLVTQASSFGAKRVNTENLTNYAVEKRLGLSFVYEQSQVDGGPKTYNKALFPSIGRTWRAVDNTFDPRKGHIIQADIGGGAKVALSDQNFVRLYGKYQQWIPVGERDVVILRAEGGYVMAPDDAGIPQNLLFRAGGTGSVRGYAYQSLGVDQGDSVVGGRILTIASAEYVHWLKGNWGVAGFIDVGDAADRFKDLKMKQGIGLGLRYKTPAGPIAIDLAYGRQAHKVRFDFFLGIAF